MFPREIKNEANSEDLCQSQYHTNCFGIFPQLTQVRWWYVAQKFSCNTSS